MVRHCAILYWGWKRGNPTGTNAHFLLRGIFLRFTNHLTSPANPTATFLHKQGGGNAAHHGVHIPLPSHPWVLILMLIANVCVCNAFFDISKLIGRFTETTSSECFCAGFIFFLTWFSLLLLPILFLNTVFANQSHQLPTPLRYSVRATIQNGAENCC